MPQSGTIIDSSKISDYLEDANKDYKGRRVWGQMFGSLDLLKQKSTNQLENQYSASVNTAFTDTSKANTSIVGSNLGTGYKQAAMAENDQALEEAYNASLQNFLSGKNQINDSIAESAYGVNSTLKQQADYTAKYANSHFDYLQNLWDKQEAGELSTNLFNEANWSKYTNEVYDDMGNLSTDEEGNPIRLLKDISEIRSGMFDEDGELTLAGVDFFDQMQNDTASRGIYSLSDYLVDNDKDLYDWQMNYNPYDHAPDSLGNSTNASSFKTMVGMTSKDSEYSFIERAFAMNEGELNTVFDSILTKAENSDADSFEDFSTEINKLTKDLGINATDVGLGELEGVLQSSIQKYKADKEALDNFATVYSTRLRTSPKNYKTLEAEKTRLEGNLTSSKATIKDNYTNIVTSMATYAQNKRRKSEIDFYGKELKSGGVISTSNNRISKYEDHYNYNMPDGTTAKYLNTVIKADNSNVRDKTRDNFSVNYNGEKYKLEVSNDGIMEVNKQKELSKLIMTAQKRGLTDGDIFYHNDRLWVVSKDKKTTTTTVRAIQNRGGFSKDYEKLLKELKAKQIID